MNTLTFENKPERRHQCEAVADGLARELREQQASISRS
jgi:hypothetical protein